jgi:hypothetical protein
MGMPLATSRSYAGTPISHVFHVTTTGLGLVAAKSTMSPMKSSVRPGITPVDAQTTTPAASSEPIASSTRRRWSGVPPR